MPMLMQARAKALRQVLEVLQRQATALCLDAQQALQTAQALRPETAGDWGAVAIETGDAVRHAAALMGTLDDALSGLDALVIRETHPDATTEEIEAIFAERDAGKF